MNQTQVEISKKHLEMAVKNLMRNDREWQVDFCQDCPMLYLYAATRTDPGDTDCVAGLDPLDFHCYRKNMLLDDPKIIAEAEEYAAEDEEAQDEIAVLTPLESSCLRMQSNLDTAIASLVGAYNGIVSTLRSEASGGDAA